ncbi:hypothetical protein TNCV_5084001 [Trichonephila clavipes]|nr:hypothetical protein TNCV_5084001 [Trichonephila clavipes]
MDKTGDYHFTSEIKQQKQWTEKEEPAPEKAKTDLSAEKAMVSVFCTTFEVHSHHPIKATHEKSCAYYPIGSCRRFPRPPSPAKEQNQADSKTR